jgi:5-methylcytosine-specific restriction endonuclease McrA
MKKKCKNCDKVFITKNKFKKWCSKHCYKKHKPTTILPKNLEKILNKSIKKCGVWAEGMGGRDVLSEKVRIRDNHTCQICKKVWKVGERKLDVHHIDENCESIFTCENYKKFNRMITLCHKCHLRLKNVKVKFRKVWAKYKKSNR